MVPLALPTNPPPRTLLLDLDGVVWLAHDPIPGSVEAIAAARQAGWRVLFVTNNSAARVADQEAALAAIGVPAVGDVVTSAVAAARLVNAGETVLVCGGVGVTEAVIQRGAIVVGEPVSGERCDVVIVGFHREFDYAGLQRAATAVRLGARLIGTNDDATYPTPGGPIPGGGAILAAVAVAAGVTPVVAGKPHLPMVDLVGELIRDAAGDEAVANALMVGDRPSTDGLFARALGCQYAHVWSGVTTPGMPVDPNPDFIADDLRGVIDAMLAGAGSQAAPERLEASG